jgi:predicted enzyme related to lactoylglutathione lyase
MLAHTGAVIFAKDMERVATFYAALVPMARVHADDSIIVLEAGLVQLVIHALPPHIAATIDVVSPPAAREDSSVKLFFLVDRLSDVRANVTRYGGWLFDASREFVARGFRAVDGVDPEGNVVQFREPIGSDA